MTVNILHDLGVVGKATPATAVHWPLNGHVLKINLSLSQIIRLKIGQMRGLNRSNMKLNMTTKTVEDVEAEKAKTSAEKATLEAEKAKFEADESKNEAEKAICEVKAVKKEANKRVLNAEEAIKSMIKHPAPCRAVQGLLPLRLCPPLISRGVMAKDSSHFVANPLLPWRLENQPRRRPVGRQS